MPQFILEDASARSTPCRIVCTQPRRISALSVSERVATERGERLGQTVGYQIRLDNRYILIFKCNESLVYTDYDIKVRLCVL